MEPEATEPEGADLPAEPELKTEAQADDKAGAAAVDEARTSK